MAYWQGLKQFHGHFWDSNRFIKLWNQAICVVSFLSVILLFQSSTLPWGSINKISRFRFNNNTPCYLLRIGLFPSTKCNCGHTDADINHFILSCLLLAHYESKFFRNLLKDDLFSSPAEHQFKHKPFFHRKCDWRYKKKLRLDF